MNKKLLVGMVAAVAIIFSVGVVIGYMGTRLANLLTQRPPYSSANLVKQVQTISELSTVKYVVEKVVVLEDVRWLPGLGESRVLLLAHGVVKGGIDLSRLREGDIQAQGSTVSVKLPPARILEVYLDERQTRVIERSTGLLRVFDKDLEQNARVQALGELRRAAQAEGINKEADARAKEQLSKLLKGLGFQHVEFQPR